MSKAETDKRFSWLDTMSDEQLQMLLKKIVSSDEEDPELASRIMEVMEEKRPEDTSASGADVDRAWADFQEYYVRGDGERRYPTTNRTVRKKSVSPKGKHKLAVKLLVPAAAMVALVLFTMPKAQGFTDIWDMFVQWTGEVFSFTNKYEGETLEEEDLQIDFSETFSDLQAALDANDVNIPLAPTWFPDGYEVFDVRVDEKDGNQKVVFSSAHRNSDGEILTVAIYRFLTVDSQISERNEAEYEKYAVNEIDHYIYENMDRTVASWYYDNYEGYISGNVSRDVIKKMIDSIYERVS